MHKRAHRKFTALPRHYGELQAGNKPHKKASNAGQSMLTGLNAQPDKVGTTCRSWKRYCNYAVG
jgi:hypothetical protein